MIRVEGLFEAHITVRNIKRSISFYRDVVGLELGIEQPERPAAFFWVGGRGRSMMGIFGAGSSDHLREQHHVAFQVTLEDVLAAPQGYVRQALPLLAAAESRLTSPSYFHGCPPHPYSLMTPTATFWNTSRCYPTRRGQNLDQYPGANGKRFKKLQGQELVLPSNSYSGWKRLTKH